MKIKIVKPTVVNGENVKAGEELDVKKSVATLLINSNKAISLEKTEVSLSLEISEEQLDVVKKELEAEFEKALAEKDKVIEELNKKLEAREAEYKALFEDIGSMTFKDLKEKYGIN